MLPRSARGGVPPDEPGRAAVPLELTGPESRLGMTSDQHLSKVEIRRFRGLSELQLGGLGRFNVLLGANDVGKTSVLEAIFLLTGFVNLQSPITIQSWRRLSINAIDDFGTLFQDLDPERPIELVGHSGGAVEQRRLKISAPYTNVEFASDSSASGDGGIGNSQEPGSAGEVADQSSSLIPAGPRVLRYDATVQPREGEPSFFSATLRAEGDKFHVKNSGAPGDQPTVSARYVTTGLGYDSRAIGDLLVRKQADQLVRFLTFINPRVRDVAVSGGIAHLDTGLDRMVPLNVFGSGMVRAANILSHCILGNERILLVDELEDGLHHAAVRPLLEALLALSRERDVQVFATTHSEALLESLLDVLDKKEFSEQRSTTRCFTLQRDSEGRVRPYRYEYEQFEHCVRHGIEIR